VGAIDAAEQTQAATFEHAISRFLRQQALRVIHALEFEPKDAASMWDAFKMYMRKLPNGAIDTSAWQALTDDRRQDLVEGFVDSLTNWSGDATMLYKVLTPLWQNAYDVGASTAQNTYKLNNINRPELIAPARLHGSQRITHVTQTTKDNVAKLVSNGLSSGMSNREIAKAIQGEMIASHSCANLIANQESGAALNAGQYDMMKAGGSSYKVWHHRPQEDPRDGHDGTPDHVSMEGEKVPFDGKFSNGLKFPRDMDGSAEEVINCRCWVEYLFGKTKAGHFTQQTKADTIKKSGDGIQWVTINGAAVPIEGGELQGTVGRRIEDSSNESSGRARDNGSAAAARAREPANTGTGGMDSDRNEQSVRGDLLPANSESPGAGNESDTGGWGSGSDSRPSLGRFLDVTKETSPNDYSRLMQESTSKHPNEVAVDQHNPEEWERMGAKLYSGNINGLSFGAAAKPDGDIVGVFSDGQGVGAYGMIRAISEGGNKLDAYAINPDGTPGGLAITYHKAGFVPVARVKYNSEFVSDDARKVLDRRDIVFYKHNGDSAEKVAENYGKYPKPTKEQYDALPVMDYDAAAAYRDKQIRNN
jgi:hypothetical protein